MRIYDTGFYVLNGVGFPIAPYDLNVTYDVETGEPLLLDLDVFDWANTSGFYIDDALPEEAKNG